MRGSGIIEGAGFAPQTRQTPADYAVHFNVSSFCSIKTEKLLARSISGNAIKAWFVSLIRQKTCGGTAVFGTFCHL